MVSSILAKEIHEQLEQLPLGQQRQVLDFARALATARAQGVPGHKLLRFAGTIEPEDLREVSYGGSTRTHRRSAGDNEQPAGEH